MNYQLLSFWICSPKCSLTITICYCSLHEEVCYFQALGYTIKWPSSPLFKLVMTWLVTGPPLVSFWCFSGCVPSVSVNGAWSLGGTTGRRDGSRGGALAGGVPTALNQVGVHANSAFISLCLWISGCHAHWHSKFVTHISGFTTFWRMTKT